MRISALTVENFRAVRRVELNDLEDSVVIAGPNGSGKSCILDAIRLLKSAYGGYQANEWHNWFGEFQINLQRFDRDVSALFQDKSKSLRMAATFQLSVEEKRYLEEHGRELIEKFEWEARTPGHIVPGFGKVVTGARDIRRYGSEVEMAVSKEFRVLRRELQKESYSVELVIEPGKQPQMAPSPIMELVFSVYEPKSIGIIDYHGAQRAYQREQLGGVNLNIDQSSDRLRQHALYNYGNKYTNVKSEMATTMVRALLAEKAGVEEAVGFELIDTIKELFEQFFPGKQFLGPVPQPGGGLEFPVRLSDGSTHDIDDLSAGEKEVVYGYLRLRSSAPKNSILLLDEPELHLNPRLIQGLPRFYSRHIASALGNQLWLVTHSDAFLRQTVGQPGFTVLHMQPAGACKGNSQSAQVTCAEDVERIIVELVGDLASYRPGAKIVIFEGADSEFDWKMTSTLFPELAQQVNPISGGDKRSVRRLLHLLDSGARSAAMPMSFFAVVDRDLGDSLEIANDKILEWDRYHIENFLLEPRFLRGVIKAMTLGAFDWSEEEILTLLKEAARGTIDKMVVHQLRQEARFALIEAVEPRMSPNPIDAAGELADCVQRSIHKVSALAGGSLSKSALEAKADELRQSLESSLRTDDWFGVFRGRDVLKRFCGEIGSAGLSYETVRNLTLAQMAEAGFRPPGMASVVSTILSGDGKQGSECTFR